MTGEIEKLADDLGASVVGCAALTPIMIAEGVELPHDKSCVSSWARTIARR